VNDHHPIRVEEVDVANMAGDVEEEDLVEGVVEVRYILCALINISLREKMCTDVCMKSHFSIT